MPFNFVGSKFVLYNIERKNGTMKEKSQIVSYVEKGESRDKGDNENRRFCVQVLLHLSSVTFKEGLYQGSCDA